MSNIKKYIFAFLFLFIVLFFINEKLKENTNWWLDVWSFLWFSNTNTNIDNNEIDSNNINNTNEYSENNNKDNLNAINSNTNDIDNNITTDKINNDKSNTLIKLINNYQLEIDSNWFMILDKGIVDNNSWNFKLTESWYQILGVEKDSILDEIIHNNQNKILIDYFKYDDYFIEFDLSNYNITKFKKNGISIIDKINIKTIFEINNIYINKELHKKDELNKINKENINISNNNIDQNNIKKVINYTELIKIENQSIEKQSELLKLIRNNKLEIVWKWIIIKKGSDNSYIYVYTWNDKNVLEYIKNNPYDTINDHEYSPFIIKIKLYWVEQQNLKTKLGNIIEFGWRLWKLPDNIIWWWRYYDRGSIEIGLDNLKQNYIKIIDTDITLYSCFDIEIWTNKYKVIDALWEPISINKTKTWYLTLETFYYDTCIIDVIDGMVSMITEIK